VTRPGRFTSGKRTRYQLYRNLIGHQNRSERERKISPLPGIDRRNIQTVASRYIDYAIRAHQVCSRVAFILSEIESVNTMFSQTYPHLPVQNINVTSTTYIQGDYATVVNIEMTKQYFFCMFHPVVL
jgi:hypothetical protein